MALQTLGAALHNVFSGLIGETMHADLEKPANAEPGPESFSLIRESLVRPGDG